MELSINPSLSAYQAARSIWIEPLLLTSSAVPAAAPGRAGPSDAAGAFFDPGSAHIGGERLVDLGLQRLRLLLFRDGSYDGFTHDIAAAVDHIGGGIGKDVGGKLSRLTI